MTRYFWPILTPCHTLSHIPGHPQRYVTHLGSPSFLVGLVQKTRTKTFCTNSQLFAWVFVPGFCQGVFSLEGFVRGRFCPFPLFSEYICYNRKLNMALNFRFHMYDKKCISMTSQALDPSPVTNCHTFSDPVPLEREVLYGRPLGTKRSTINNISCRPKSFQYRIQTFS